MESSVSVYQNGTGAELNPSTGVATQAGGSSAGIGGRVQ